MFVLVLLTNYFFFPSDYSSWQEEKQEAPSTSSSLVEAEGRGFDPSRTWSSSTSGPQGIDSRQVSFGSLRSYRSTEIISQQKQQPVLRSGRSSSLHRRTRSLRPRHVRPSSVGL